MTVVNQMGIQAPLVDGAKHLHKFKNTFKRKTIFPFNIVRLSSKLVIGWHLPPSLL